MLKKVLEFGHMVRFSHSLFAMPFAIGSMWVAANGFRGMAAAEAVKMIALIVGCMVTARNSAMSFNRIADADIDAKNPRTAKRHLPAGRLSKASVIAFLAVNGVLFVLFAARLRRCYNRLPVCWRYRCGSCCFLILTGNALAGFVIGSWGLRLA